MISGHASPFTIYISTICLTALACTFVGLRLITRLLIVRWSGLDDVCILVAIVFSVLLEVSVIEQTRFGLGQHMFSLNPQDLLEGFKWIWAFIWLYYCVLAFTKLSILLQYLRIFSHPTFVKVCWALITTTIVWGLFAALTGIFNCTPIDRFWLDLEKHPPGCINRVTLWYANAAVNIATNVATALLPLPLINGLNIPKRQKIMVMALFAVGLVTSLMSLLRLVWLTPLATSTDATWESALSTIWSVVEVNTAIIYSCVPTLKGLVQRYFPRLLGSSLRSGRVDVDHHHQQSPSAQSKGATELKAFHSCHTSSNHSKRFPSSSRHPSVREMVITFDRTPSTGNDAGEEEEAIVASASVSGHFRFVEDEEIIHTRRDLDRAVGTWRSFESLPPEDQNIRGVNGTVVLGLASLPKAWLETPARRMG